MAFHRRVEVCVFEEYANSGPPFKGNNLDFAAKTRRTRWRGWRLPELQNAADEVRITFLSPAGRHRRCGPGSLRQVIAGRAARYDHPCRQIVPVSRHPQPGAKRTDALDEYDPAFTDGVDIERQVEASERFELFCRAVARLPDVCRRAFVLRRVYGFSQREIAEHLGISIKTVEAHLAKGIVRCTDFMELFDAPAVPAGESLTEHHHE